MALEMALAVTDRNGSRHACRTRKHCGVTQEQSRPRDANPYPFRLLALVPGTRIGVDDITTQVGAGGGGRETRIRIAGVCCHQGLREIRLPQFTKGNE